MKAAHLLLGITVATASLGLNLSSVKAEAYHQNTGYSSNSHGQKIAFRTVCKYKKVFVPGKFIPAHYEHGHYVPKQYVPGHYETRKVCKRIVH